MSTTKTRRARICPPSAVADQILTWAEVQIGDLVLHYGRLATVDDADAAFVQEGRRSFLIDGSWRYCRVGDLTAVRRYDTSEETAR